MPTYQASQTSCWVRIGARTFGGHAVPFWGSGMRASSVVWDARAVDGVSWLYLVVLLVVPIAYTVYIRRRDNPELRKRRRGR
ncbi:hypothetical protein GCM10025864_45010 [Luteimicrobium album]|uniref:Uncharacterized protein n=1 Tax=Luteimicrobium album TaxID=1054550 RepID=A0ABQ6HXI1_9MICO|nr:hypothetical protein GCM10025864_00340 [Luteimicrobium album]GMA26680.1 hypothetical protein GCM10025864_44390 [Luteimicrobium album]GMA26742.1 hypothetical protein GCM10025864_45010 [Luteimicrobium album]